jgi:hypothetical protein
MFRLRAILVALLQFGLKLVFAPLLHITARTSRAQYAAPRAAADHGQADFAAVGNVVLQHR